MNFNFIAIGLAALIPILIGFVWYHEKVFGTAWMKANSFTTEDMKKGNMTLILGLSLFFSFILAFEMNFVTVHQSHTYSAMMDTEMTIDDPSSEIGADYASFMQKYGSNYRTYKHGALHGLLASVFFMLPILAINALFERRSFKYVAIHAGYWTVCLVIMSSIISGMV